MFIFQNRGDNILFVNRKRGIR